MIEKDLFYFDLDVEDKEELMNVIGEDLYKKGYVKSTYIKAILDREQTYPTGLPLKYGIAIPHTSIEYASANKLVFIKPKHAIEFHEMGNDDAVLDVELVIFLVIKDKDDHMKVLSTIIEIIQDEVGLDYVMSAQNLFEFEERIIEKFEITLGE